MKILLSIIMFKNIFIFNNIVIMNYSKIIKVYAMLKHDNVFRSNLLSVF